MFKLVVLSSLLALAAAKPSVVGPFGLAGLAGLGWAGGLGAAHLAAPVVAAPVVAAAAPLALGAGLVGHGVNYRGPLSLAPGQPANILAADGRPLDTLSVNLDRAAHYTARAVDHAGVAGHWLGKRSAPLWAPAAWGHAAPVAWSTASRVDIPARLVAPAPLAVPAALHGPIAPLGLGVLGHGARLAHW